MWVAIYISGAGGIVRVEEFRKRPDISTAVWQFENEYTPPATGYAGIDVGWTSYTDPPDGMVWGIDTDQPVHALVPMASGEEMEFEASSKMSDRSVVSDQDWEDIDGIVTSVPGITLQWLRARGRAIGQVKVSGSGFEMRIVRGDPAIQMHAQAYTHSDTAGGWQIFVFDTDEPPVDSLTIYRLQARLNGAASASVRFGNLSISAPRD